MVCFFPADGLSSVRRSAPSPTEGRAGAAWERGSGDAFIYFRKKERCQPKLDLRDTLHGRAHDKG